jgi:PKD repeat protein
LADAYAWSIPGYQSSNAVPPELLLSRKGTYTVTLTASKGNQQDSVTKQLAVENDPAMKAAYFFSRSWEDSSDFSNHIGSGFGLLAYEKDRKNNIAGCINMGSSGGALFFPDNLLQNTGTATTISIWFKAATLDKNPLLGCWQTGAETTVAVPCIYFDNTGKLRMKFPTGTPAPQIEVPGILVNTWYHLVLTGSNTVQKAYINGTFAGEITGAAINYGAMDFAALGYACVPAGNNWPGIGVSRWFTYSYKGWIDDVQIYNRMLTEAEVKALYEE